MNKRMFFSKRFCFLVFRAYNQFLFSFAFKVGVLSSSTVVCKIKTVFDSARLDSKCVCLVTFFESLIGSAVTYVKHLHKSMYFCIY